MQGSIKTMNTGKNAMIKANKTVTAIRPNAKAKGTKKTEHINEHRLHDDVDDDEVP